MAEILLEHMVAHRNGQPYVTMKSSSKRLQLEPNEARCLALDLLQAAALSEVDAFFMHWLGQHSNLTLPQAAILLQEFRSSRSPLRPDQVRVVLPDEESGEVETVNLDEARSSGLWMLDIAAISEVQAYLARLLLDQGIDEARVNGMVYDFRENYLSRRVRAENE